MIALDLDGTLITCKKKQTVIMAELLDENFDAELYWKNKTNGLNNSQSLEKQGYGRIKIRKVCAEWVDIIEEKSSLSLDEVFCDVFPVLKRVNNKILITARNNSENLFWQLKTLGIYDLFNEVICVSPFDSINSKARFLSMYKPRFYIGDSEVDYYAALAAGVSFFPLTRGQRSEGYWRKEIGLNNLHDNISGII